jgi:hypothetical protein
MVRIMTPVLRAGIDGGWKRSPFFIDGHVPVVTPRVLSEFERDQARRKTLLT